MQTPGETAQGRGRVCIDCLREIDFKTKPARWWEGSRGQLQKEVGKARRKVVSLTQLQKGVRVTGRKELKTDFKLKSGKQYRRK